MRFMHTWFPQELHSQVTLSGVGRGHGKWEARQELPSLPAWLALKEGEGHALMASPAGVHNLVPPAGNPSFRQL